MSRQLFDAVAADYDRVGADYPSQLYDALESAMGQPLLRADVLDVGAGTGIATRALAGRGAHVVALDPGPRVLEVLRSRSTTRVRAVLGDGNALPFRDDVFDLVAFSQSMRWTDAGRAARESFRVLKPKGLCAAWWNRHDMSVPWMAAHERRLFERRGQPPHDDESWFARLLAEPPHGHRVATFEIPWSRPISLVEYGRSLHTQSYVFALEAEADDFVEQELDRLAHEFPEGVLDEPFTTFAVVARA